MSSDTFVEDDSGWEDCSSEQSDQKQLNKPIVQDKQDSQSDSESYDSESESSYSYIEERSETHESQKDIVYWFKQREQGRILREHPLVQLLMKFKKPPDRNNITQSPSFYDALSNYTIIDLSDQKKKEIQYTNNQE